jgi:hypothetical protein
MTLDDLVKLFKAAKVATRPYVNGEHNGDRAGIRAVVTALRDEIFDARGNASYGSLAIFDLFNEILGARFAEDKAAGGSARKGERADGGDLVLSNTAENFKAPAADPDVCEWTRIALSNHYITGYGNRRYWDVNCTTECVECQRKIKFVEAK